MVLTSAGLGEQQRATLQALLRVHPERVRLQLVSALAQAGSLHVLVQQLNATLDRQKMGPGREVAEEEV